MSEGDIALARTGASVGKSYQYRNEDGRLVFAGFLIRIRVNRTKIVPTFLANYLTSEQYWDWVRVMSARSGQPGINGTEYASLTVPMPPPEADREELAEQQRIAACLASLDACVAAQERKVEALKTHKRGLMRQLFPRRGETIPRLRFPEFWHAPEWEEKSLESLSESVSSGRDKLDAQGAFDLHGSTGVIGKTLNGTYSGKFILVARVGANAGLLNIASGNFGVTDNTLVIVAKDTRSIQFLFYCLDVFGLNRLIFGSGQPLITGGQLKGLIFPIPSKVEQQRIADCLSSLDAQIAAEFEKLDALKTHKKGLMQQLFPYPEDDL